MRSSSASGAPCFSNWKRMTAPSYLPGGQETGLGVADGEVRADTEPRGGRDLGEGVARRGDEEQFAAGAALSPDGGQVAPRGITLRLAVGPKQPGVDTLIVLVVEAGVEGRVILRPRPGAEGDQAAARAAHDWQAADDEEVGATGLLADRTRRDRCFVRQDRRSVLASHHAATSSTRMRAA
jgi:hypothetical protein